jgi:hypothetical protein
MFVNGTVRDTKKTTKWNLTLCLVGRGAIMEKKVIHGIKCFKCRKRTEVLKLGVGFICFECQPEGEE